MKDIFLSRPTWVAPEFDDGLDLLYSLLGSFDLHPRTLGVSDHPTESPLDEVISIMDQCVGTIVLGYPQIVIEKGVLKTEPTDSLVLATEWIHIEAGLAYAKGHPLVVYHHEGVSRGIFDRGALGKFIHEIDMRKSDWPLEAIGSLKTWKNRLPDKASSKQLNSGQEDDLAFDERFGIFVSKETGFSYCAKCYQSSPQRKVELQVRDNGWNCSVCDTFYSNPDYIDLDGGIPDRFKRMF